MTYNGHMIGGLLTTAEVAERLRVSKRTVTRMAGDGTLKPAATVPGGRGVLLFAPDDVARLQAERRKTEAPIRADALREAADDFGLLGTNRMAVADWLRQRADEIESRNAS